MAKINRYDGNVQAFAAESLSNERTVFGSETQDDTLDQNINADFLRGWGIVGVNENPTKQDFNAAFYTLGQLIAYLHQAGIPEWNAAQEVFEGSVVTTTGGIYRLKAGGDSTIDPDTDDGTNWEKAPTSSDYTRTFESVADLQASGAVVTGQFVRTLGYYTPGDGGGNDYEIVAAGTGTDDGGSFIDLDNGLQAKGLFVNGVYTKQFGCLANGVDNDRLELQLAVDFVQETSPEGSVLHFSPGTYLVSGTTRNEMSGWWSVIVLGNNITLEGERATLLIKDLSSFYKAVIFMPRGDNITIRGFTFISENATSISVGFGDAHDDFMEDGREYKNLKVTDCVFFNSQLAVSISTNGGSLTPNSTVNGVVIDKCTSYGITGGGGGNYNASCILPGKHRVKNVVYNNLVAYDGGTAASFNIYAVSDFKISNCRSEGNGYAGLEVENGSVRGEIVNYSSSVDYRGLWIDDSSEVLVSNIQIRDTITSRGILITRQGFDEEPNYNTTNISITNAILRNCKISIEPWGSAPQGNVGDIKISNFTVEQATSDFDNLVFVQSADSVILSSGKLIGTTTEALRAGLNDEGVLSVSDVYAVSQGGANDTADFIVVGTNGQVKAAFSEFTTYTANSAIFQRIKCTSDSVAVADIDRGQSVFFNYGQNPEGNLTAGPGSMAYGSGGDVYLKNNGTGNTGWLRVATV